MSVCPNCGYDVSVHDLFAPPRCPVIRLRFRADGTIATRSSIADLTRPEGALPTSLSVLGKEQQ